MSKKISDNRFEHVYCTNCKHWDKLYKTLLNDENIAPSPCCVCYPYDTEDSVEKIKRNKYEVKNDTFI